MSVIVINQQYSTEGSGRKLVRLSNGWLVAGVKTHEYFYFYVSKDNGKTFQPLTYMYHQYLDDNDLALASYGTTVYVLRGYGSSYVRCNKFDALTVSNINIHENNYSTIQSGFTSVGNVSLAINPSNGHLHAAWSAKSSSFPNSFNIFYAKSEDGGVTWIEHEMITEYNTTATQFKQSSIVLKSDGYPAIIFRQENSSYNEIYINYKTVYSNWLTSNSNKGIRIYSGSSYGIDCPSPVVDIEGIIHLSWSAKDQSSPSGYNIYYSKSIDNGETWSTPQKLTNHVNNTYINTSSISVDKTSRIVIVYGNYPFSSPVLSNVAGVWDSSLEMNDLQYNPSVLYDPYFIGEFGELPSAIANNKAKGVMFGGSYITNQAPILTLRDSQNQTINQNQAIKHSNKAPFLFKILANDSDTNDTLQYSIWLRDSEYQTWTSIGKGVDTSITIPFASLLMGNNGIQVKVKDSNGAETTITFVVTNINPESYSQKHVYDLIVALGYSPTGYSSLRAIRYPEYNKTTLSLAELVNFLQ